MSADLLVALLIGAPLAAFALLALVAPIRRAGQAAGGIVALASAASLGAAIALLVDQLQNGAVRTLTWRWLPEDGETLAELGYLIDGTSAPMLVVVGLVALCVQIYSLGYLSDEPGPDLGRYFSWHALFVVVMQTLVLAPNLMQLFLGWELVGLCSYLLIGYYWRTAEAGKASLKAFWVNKFADSFLLLGLVVLVVQTGSFGWDMTGIDGGTITLVGLLLLVGTVGKSAQMPLHVWLPDAMAGPTPVSALLHAATMVAAGIYLVVRGWPIFSGSEATLSAMIWLGSVTAVCAAFFALLQDDIKKLLAYSTCSQLGYMLAALGAGGLASGYFHLTTHAFFKALLFLGAGSVIHAVHSNSMKDMGGLGRAMPVTFVLFVIGSAALAGIPPFSGFFSKDLVLESVVLSGNWVPLALLLVGVGLTATYMTRACFKVFAGPKNEHAHESGLSMVGPMVLLAILAVGAGGITSDFTAMVGDPMAFHVTAWGGAALVLALLGVGAGWFLSRRDGLPIPAVVIETLAERPLDGMYEKAWRNVVLLASAGVAWVDRFFIDGLINLGAWGIIQGGERIRRTQTSQIADYLWAIALGLFVVAGFSAMLGVV